MTVRRYHWTSILSPSRSSRALSYICGITNVYAWIATTAGTVIIIPQVLLAVVVAFNPDYTPEPYQIFLVYLGFNVLCCIHNIFTLKKTLFLYDVACMLVSIAMTRTNASSPAQSILVLRRHDNLPRSLSNETERFFRLDTVRKRVRLAKRRQLSDWNNLS